MIEHRITTEGRGATGNALRPYTAPYQKFKEAPQLTKRGRDLGLGSSRFSGKTDYSLTGAWWKDIQIRAVEVNGIDTTISIAPKSVVNQKIMEALTKRDGFPLQLSEAEEAVIVEQLNNELIQLIDKYFPLND